MNCVGQLFLCSAKALKLPIEHDVVVVGHDNKKKKSVVKTITSMESGIDPNAKKVLYRKLNLERASKGEVQPIPQKILGSKHWSGVFVADTHVVDDKDLKKAKYCTGSVPTKYKNLL